MFYNMFCVNSSIFLLKTGIFEEKIINYPVKRCRFTKKMRKIFERNRRFQLIVFMLSQGVFFGKLDLSICEFFRISGCFGIFSRDSICVLWGFRDAKYNPPRQSASVVRLFRPDGDRNYQ